MCAYPAEATLPLFQREVTERLSASALELLLSRAEVFVEGGAVKGGSAAGAFYGSAMLTLDLERCADRLRAPLDEVATKKLCAAIDHDRDARRAVTARALDVARARLVVPDDVKSGALRCRVDGARLYIDVELESPEAGR